MKSPPESTRTNRMLPPSDQPLGSANVAALWSANSFRSERTTPRTAIEYVYVTGASAWAGLAESGPTSRAATVSATVAITDETPRLPGPAQVRDIGPWW